MKYLLVIIAMISGALISTITHAVTHVPLVIIGKNVDSSVYYILEGDVYHPVNDCSSDEEIFSILGEETQTVDLIEESSINAQLGAIYSCDIATLPTLLDGTYDNHIYSRFNIYMSRGITGGYYIYSNNSDDPPCLASTLQSLLGASSDSPIYIGIPPDYDSSKSITIDCQTFEPAPEPGILEAVKISVLGYAYIEDEINYFIKTGRFYHRVTACDTANTLFDILAKPSHALFEINENAIIGKRAADLSCDSQVTPTLDYQDYDLTLYIDQVEGYHYISNGLAGGYYLIDSDELSANNSLSTISSELFSTAAYTRVYAEPSDFETPESAQLIGDLSEYYTLNSVASEILVIGFNKLVDEKIRSTYLPIAYLDAQAFITNPSAFDTAALVLKTYLKPDDDYELSEIDPAILANSILFSMCSNPDDCTEDKRLFAKASLYEGPVGDTIIPLEFTEEEMATVASAKHIETLNDQDLSIWNHSGFQRKFEQCDGDLLPSTVENPTAEESIVSYLHSHGLTRVLGLQIESGDDEWFQRNKSIMTGSATSNQINKFRCPTVATPNICVIKLDKSHYTTQEFQSVIADTSSCDSNTDTLELSLTTNTVVEGNRKVHITNTLSFDSIHLQSSDKQIKTIEFRYQCKAISDCTNLAKESFLYVYTGKEFTIENINIVSSLNKGNLSEDTQFLYQLTALDITNKTKLKLLNSQIVSNTSTQDPHTWFTGVKITSGSRLYCTTCKITADHLGINSSGAKIAIIGQEENVSVIQSDYIGIYLNSNTQLLTTFSTVSGDRVLDIGTKALAYMNLSNAEYHGDPEEGDNSVFTFRTRGFEYRHNFTLTLRDSTITGLPVGNTSTFSLIDYESTDGSATSLLQKVTLYQKDQLEAYTDDYYFSCNGPGSLLVWKELFPETWCD